MSLIIRCDSCKKKTNVTNTGFTHLIFMGNDKVELHYYFCSFECMRSLIEQL